MLFPYAPVTGVAEDGDGDRNVPRTTKMRMPIISTRRFLGSKTAKILLSSSFFWSTVLGPEGALPKKGWWTWTPKTFPRGAALPPPPPSSFSPLFCAWECLAFSSHRHRSSPTTLFFCPQSELPTPSLSLHHWRKISVKRQKKSMCM